MARPKIISKKCLCVYTCKKTRHCGSVVYLTTTNSNTKLNTN